jgi:hypothetical protein
LLAIRKHKLVEIEGNPTNCHEARPIEDFWSLLKGRVYARGGKHYAVDNTEYCLKKINVDAVQRLSESTHRRIKIIKRNGVLEVR